MRSPRAAAVRSTCPGPRVTVAPTSRGLLQRLGGVVGRVPQARAGRGAIEPVGGEIDQPEHGRVVGGRARRHDHRAVCRELPLDPPSAPSGSNSRQSGLARSVTRMGTDDLRSGSARPLVDEVGEGRPGADRPVEVAATAWGTATANGSPGEVAWGQLPEARRA